MVNPQPHPAASIGDRTSENSPQATHSVLARPAPRSYTERLTFPCVVCNRPAGRSRGDLMVTRYLLPCSCGREIPVEMSQAGQTLSCPCGARLEVPTMRDLAQLKRDEGRSTSEPSERTRERRPPRGRRARAASPPVWGTRQRLLFLGGIVALIGLTVLGAAYFTRPRVVQVDELSPLGLWRLWHDLRQGIDVREPWEQYYLDASRMHGRWMLVGASIAAVGLLTAAASLWMPNRRERVPALRSRRPSGPPRPPGAAAGPAR